jgi:hypothetical protein
MLRWLLLLVLSTTTAGCELVGDIFQAGFIIGIIVVIAIVAIIAWIAKRFRG